MIDENFINSFVDIDYLVSIYLKVMSQYNDAIYRHKDKVYDYFKRNRYRFFLYFLFNGDLKKLFKDYIDYVNSLTSLKNKQERRNYVWRVDNFEKFVNVYIDDYIRRKSYEERLNSIKLPDNI